MKLLKVSILSFFVFCSLLLGSTLHAATYTMNNGKAVVLADVNVYEAKIISQKGNEINISFDIDNGQGVQSGIKYGVSLVKGTGESQFSLDEMIYPEILSLSSNSTIKKNIKYTAPASISGEYTLLVTIKNESGMPMGMATAGKVTLTSNLKAIEILPETCFLSVVGEKNSPKYALIQGVDIEKTENLKLTCTAKNPSSVVVSATPSYETYLRNVYGEMVTQNGGDIDPISFKALEKKSISLVLPKTTKPQSYDIKIELKSGAFISNTIKVHYVLRGISATIQNFSLDKDYYSKNDISNISFIWSPSADSFMDSRFGASKQPIITLVASITNDQKKECIAPINQIMDIAKAGKVDLSANIIADCNNPQATVTLSDDKGNILDQKLLSFESKKDNTVKTSTNSSSKIILVIFGFLVVAGIAFYFINLKRKENETINQ